MNKLSTISLTIDSKTDIKAVQFTEVSKEQMMAINKYLGAQAFQEEHLDDIIEGFNDGDKLIPLFYKNGDVSWIDLNDWVFVDEGEVHAVCTITSLFDDMTEMVIKELSNE